MVISIPALTPQGGELNISYKPIGSSIAIDGKNVGTTPTVIRNVLAGKHNVTISMNGYTPFSTSVNIENGQTARLDGSLQRVRTTPSGATLRGTCDGAPLKIVLNIKEDGTASGMYHNLKANVKMKVNGRWQHNRAELTGYIKDVTYKFDVECDRTSSTYEIGTKYTGKLYISWPNGKKVKDLIFKVEPYE